MITTRWLEIQTTVLSLDSRNGAKGTIMYVVIVFLVFASHQRGAEEELL